MKQGRVSWAVATIAVGTSVAACGDTAADAGATASAGSGAASAASAGTPASSAADSSSGATSASVGSGGQAGASPGALPLGSVQDQGPTSCPGSGSNCRSLLVSCPGTKDIAALVQVIEPSGTPAGTVLTFTGAAGTTLNSGAQYVAQSYRVVVFAWATEWEVTGTDTPSIKAAACRPATLVKWAFDGPHAQDKSTGF